MFIPRRRFLQLSGISSLSLLLGGCGSSLFEDVVYKGTKSLNENLEAFLFNEHSLVKEFPPSAIEPEALLVNSFNFTPEIDPKTFLLKIDGDVKKSLSLSLTQLEKMPFSSMTIRHVCVEGWSAIVQWGGVRLREIISLAQPLSQVRYVYFTSADGYYESWDIASALHPQTLLAYQKNGQSLSPENGAPLRLASPIKLGYKQSKWVNRITLLTHKPRLTGYWEDQGYEWFGGL